MKILISPAKALDFESPSDLLEGNIPLFLKQAETLVKECCKLSVAELQDLMSISPKLGQLNASRFLAWSSIHSAENSKQALFAFDGDVYDGIDAKSLTHDQILFLEQNLRILSGLYGILRPLDYIQPYRLEMGSKLETKKGSDLYKYWGSTQTNYLIKELEKDSNEHLINLASHEYFKVIQPARIKNRIITPVFKEYKNGSLKIISFFAKKARGQMVRYIAQNHIVASEKLKEFAVDGYAFTEELSTINDWVFTR
jgi:cytoplasmic iron level regulating protein YaaA (DUF328/UPF0246 family)